MTKYDVTKKNLKESPFFPSCFPFLFGNEVFCSKIFTFLNNCRSYFMINLLLEGKVISFPVKTCEELGYCDVALDSQAR